MKILITGASGLIGKALIDQLRLENHELYVITRGSRNDFNYNVKIIHGDLNESKIPELFSIEWDVVFNLLGESIAQRWTSEAKRKIYRSRIITTKNLINSLNKVNCFISASAIGIYGDRNQEILTEKSSLGDDFLAQVCKEWENSAQLAQSKFTECRVVQLRFGLVLAKTGGALKKMISPFSLGLGGALGDGKQMISWVHLEDLVRILIYTMKSQDILGPINCVSPKPVSNKEWTYVLSQIFGRKPFLSVPRCVLKLALGEMASVLLFSQNVYPEKLTQSEFKFNFPDLKSAFENLLEKDTEK